MNTKLHSTNRNQNIKLPKKLPPFNFYKRFCDANLTEMKL